MPNIQIQFELISIFYIYLFLNFIITPVDIAHQQNVLRSMHDEILIKCLLQKKEKNENITVASLLLS